MAIPNDLEGTWFNVTVSLDAGELRRADAAMFAGDGTVTTGARGGVARHADTSLAVTVDGSDVVTVQPGSVLVGGNASAGSGPYRFGIASAITGSLTARNATNPRITLVVFRALDDDVVNTHDAYKGQIGFIDGTPAASPTAPALPSMAVELGRITVPQTGGGAATVDSTNRTYATALGAEIIVPTLTKLPATAATYQRGRALDTGVTYEWSGSTWTAALPSWTPSWTSSGTTPAIGNGTMTGGYRQDRQMVFFWLNVAFGSTTSAGTGTWRFTLPVTPKSGIRWSFSGEARDESAAADYTVRAWWDSSASKIVVGTPATTAGNQDRGASTSSPFSWGNTDVLFISGSYEAA